MWGCSRFPSSIFHPFVVIMFGVGYKKAIISFNLILLMKLRKCCLFHYICRGKPKCGFKLLLTHLVVFPGINFLRQSGHASLRRLMRISSETLISKHSCLQWMIIKISLKNSSRSSSRKTKNSLNNISLIVLLVVCAKIFRRQCKCFALIISHMLLVWQNYKKQHSTSLPTCSLASSHPKFHF